MSSCCCSGSTCCVCIGGVNYTKACAACGSSPIAMSTAKPNVSVSQNAGGVGGCGGAANLSSLLNAVGRWGTVLTATAQGKPVSSGGTQVGAKGSTALPGNFSGGSLLLILVIIGVFIFLLRK
jgi:hypothetical protein